MDTVFVDLAINKKNSTDRHLLKSFDSVTRLCLLPRYLLDGVIADQDQITLVFEMFF